MLSPSSRSSQTHFLNLWYFATRYMNVPTSRILLTCLMPPPPRLKSFLNKGYVLIVMNIVTSKSLRTGLPQMTPPTPPRLYNAKSWRVPTGLNEAKSIHSDELTRLATLRTVRLNHLTRGSTAASPWDEWESSSLLGVEAFFVLFISGFIWWSKVMS